MRDADALTLIRPDIAFKAEYLAMLQEHLAVGESRQAKNLDLAHQDFAAFVRALTDRERGIGLPSGYVPGTTFWTVKDGVTLVGEIQLRHELSLNLEHHGGHIGYQIRPSQRRKGYGTRQLALCLEEARKLGLNRVMITCDVDNIGSAKIIEHNGGKLASQGISNFSGKMISRYWIDLAQRE
jgi:predicted acetyltransferase